MQLHKNIMQQLPMLFEATTLEIDPNLANFPFEYPYNTSKYRTYSTTYSINPKDLLSRNEAPENQTLCLVGAE